MNERIDELQLQRLIDGAMTDNDRRGFLDRLDKHPESWREVALAFVEEQVWQHEIGAEQFGRGAAEEPCVEVSRPVRGFSWGLLAAVAASILILPCLGFYLGQVTQRASLVAVAENQRTVADGNDQARPSVRQSFYPQKRSDELVQPLPVGAQTLGNERLANLGYRLDSETQYFAGQLDDGRQLIVPVRTVMVSYHGQ